VLLTEREFENMSTFSEAPGLSRVKSFKQIEDLVVQSNPADSLLTMEAFKAAGLKSGLHCVSEGEDALMVCAAARSLRPCSHSRPDFPGPVAAQSFGFRSLKGYQVDPGSDAHPDCGCRGFG